MQVYYAEAQQSAFPYGVSKIAGPFETFGEAAEAATRLRPMYPGCNTRPRSASVNMKKGAAILGGPKIEERTTPWTS